MLSRRNFIKAASTAAIATSSPNRLWARAVSQAPKAKITKIEVVTYKGPKKTAAHLEIVSDSGPVGRFGPLGRGLDGRLEKLAPKLGELLIAKDPLDRNLEFETLWNALYPAHPLAAYAKDADPLTGQKIWGRTRGKKQRHTETGMVIMTLSCVDNALWDLRGKLLGKPVHRLIGKANRNKIPLYTRVGEGRDLGEARRAARDFYDRGHKRQKWYFVYGPSDGPAGLRKNLELVRVLREELGPDAVLMFDNHSMRYEIGVDWVVALAKEMLIYKPFWLEEPTSPDDVEGYAKIKGETGITIATGEHNYTRWQIKPLLDRNCIDWVQSDPDWCGGISEWLRICDMARRHTGVRVVPHSDNILTDCQCVASQPESLCPMLEFNAGQTASKLSFRTRTLKPDVELLTMPHEPGLGPDIDLKKCKRI